MTPGFVRADISEMRCGEPRALPFLQPDLVPCCCVRRLRGEQYCAYKGFSSSPRGGGIFRHHTKQGTNTGSCLGPLESRKIVEAGFGIHVDVESGLLVIVVSDAGSLRVVSGGVGDLFQAPAV